MPARRTPTDGAPAPAAGQKLRALREAAGLPLVELEARLAVELAERGRKGIDAAHILRIETGAIKRPMARTLEAILDALDARFRERREVLAAFGYAAPWTLPTPPEVAEVQRLTAHEVEDATWPVWLIDHGQRIWAWNRYLPRLIGMEPDDPALEQFRGATIFDLAFNPVFATRRFIANGADYLPMLLRFIRTALRPFASEPWCIALVARCRTFPGFAALWDALPAEPEEWLPQQRIVPMAVAVPGVARPLAFRLSSVDFFLDPRFHLAHFNPFGAAALRQCAVWAEAEGVL